MLPDNPDRMMWTSPKRVEILGCASPRAGAWDTAVSSLDYTLSAANDEHDRERFSATP
jgi:hypothetical protein